MSLLGKTILVTRQPHQARGLLRAIEARGGKTMLLPLIRTAPPDSWEECDRALGRISSYDGVIFTSANGVEGLTSRAAEIGVDLEPLQQRAAYVLGEATLRAASTRGFTPEPLPAEFSSRSLAEAMRERGVRQKTFLLPRAAVGMETLPEMLRASGAVVDTVTVYQTLGPTDAEGARLRGLLAGGGIDGIVFASPSAVRHFAGAIPDTLRASLDGRIALIAIGPTTAAALRQWSLPCDLVAPQAAPEALAGSMDTYFSGVP